MKPRPSIFRVLLYFVLFIIGTNFIFKKIEEYDDKKRVK